MKEVVTIKEPSNVLEKDMQDIKYEDMTPDFNVNTETEEVVIKKEFLKNIQYIKSDNITDDFCSKREINEEFIIKEELLDIPENDEGANFSETNNFEPEDSIIEEDPDEYFPGKDTSNEIGLHPTSNNNISIGKRSQKCSMCQKIFKDLKSLKSHKKIHSGEKPIVCDVCRKTFSNNRSLKQHKIVHIEEKPYSCDLCQKSFARTSDLRSHKRYHSGENPYICNICQKPFKMSGDLKEHKLTHSFEKQFPCDVCQKTFATKDNLRKHKIIHSSEKSYECNICQKKFKACGSLKKHKLIHSDKKPYSCNECQETFEEKFILKSHQLIHNGRRRIVELETLGEQLWCLSCKDALSLQYIENEVRRGMASQLTIRCHNCLLLNQVSTSNQQPSLDKRSVHFSINSKAALAAVHCGIGWSQLNKFFTFMNIPCLDSNTFRKYKEKVESTPENLSEEKCGNTTIQESINVVQI